MEASRLLRLPAVEKKSGLKKSSIYAKVKAGTFPQPVKLSERAVAWYAHEIDEWINELPRVVTQEA